MELFDRTIDYQGLGIGIGRDAPRVDGILSATATLDFASIAEEATGDLTVTVTGAVVGDFVAVSPTQAAPDADLSYMGFVSAADTVTVRALNNGTGANNPASQTFRVVVVQFTA